MNDYCTTGDIVEISKLDGKWKRQPDNIRYNYASAPTRCPLCLDDTAGVPWAGWFSCDSKGCCVALVETGEVFTPVTSEEPSK